MHIFLFLAVCFSALGEMASVASDRFNAFLRLGSNVQGHSHAHRIMEECVKLLVDHHPVSSKKSIV